MTGTANAIPAGEACTFQLPPDPRCASLARSLLAETMSTLMLPGRLIDDAKLSVSELATNAHVHAGQPAVPPELWIWARTRPRPELVISIFDTSRSALPTTAETDLLAEHGKGLGIVAALSSETGAHFTRSRLACAPVRGKAVWFAIPLPATWPDCLVAPAHAAQRLLLALQQRGIHTVCRSDDIGISVITAGQLNVWVEHRAFSWRQSKGYTHQPLIDVQETAEQIVGHIEAGRSIRHLLPRPPREPTR
ncbi:ATP-binding protein [Actinomadura sp. 9N407]|uniref:ATP-binding protein n=1 Tax=Actinomadura sp. 9N407 TaxID=3375154 RepID=UPI003793C609